MTNKLNNKKASVTGGLRKEVDEMKCITIQVDAQYDSSRHSILLYSNRRAFATAKVNLSDCLFKEEDITGGKRMFKLDVTFVLKVASIGEGSRVGYIDAIWVKTPVTGFIQAKIEHYRPAWELLVNNPEYFHWKESLSIL